MKRIALMILRLWYRMPSILHHINKLYKHKDEYSFEQRVEYSRSVLRLAIKKGRVNLQIYGQENLPKETGYFVAPNHQGMFDILALFDGIEQPFKIVYKKELHDVPYIGKALDYMDFKAIDRENLRSSIKVIRDVTKELTEGITWVIFPEGTRSKKQNEMLDFKGGTFRCALDSHCPIVPCAMIDCFKVLDNNTIKKVDCQMHFLPPIEYDEYKNMSPNDLASYVQGKIQECMKEYAK